MKKNLKEHLPILIAFSLVMFSMAILSAFYNITISLIQICISLISLVSFSLAMFNFKSYTNKLFSKTANDIDFANIVDINKFNLPAIIFSLGGEILWVNKKFTEDVDNDSDIVGSSIENILSANEIEKVKKDVCIDIKYKAQYFTCFGAAFKSTMTVYFYNDTKIKQEALNYRDSRPVVISMLFDNRKELVADEDYETDTLMVASVESTLRQWLSNVDGIFRKISRGKYIFITEERYIKQFKETKFSIIDKVHEVKLKNNNYATVSIGIGHLAKTLKESEDWSKKALDMALGRGGDQVVIKSGQDYEFFGGMSKGTTRSDTVRSRVIASALSNHIRQSSNVLIMGHRFSDLDSVGSCIALCGAARRGLDRQAFVVIDRKETTSSILVESVEDRSSEKIFISPKEALEKCNDDTLLIIVDTHNPEFIESRELYEKCKKIVVIDHHRMMVTRIKNALIFYHEPYASSASELVTELVQYMGDYTVNSMEAEGLIAGIMLDTKNFILKTGVRTFEAAAFLRRRGADTVEVKRMFSDSIDSYKTRYEIVSQAEIFNNCAVACADEYNDENIKTVAAQAADELLSIQYVKASFVLFQIPGGISISARSFGDINVQIIMEKLGGGGHQTMAGAQLYDTDIISARERLVDIIREISE